MFYSAVCNHWCCTAVGCMFYSAVCNHWCCTAVGCMFYSAVCNHRCCTAVGCMFYSAVCNHWSWETTFGNQLHSCLGHGLSSLLLWSGQNCAVTLALKSPCQTGHTRPASALGICLAMTETTEACGPVQRGRVFQALWTPTRELHGPLAARSPSRKVSPKAQKRESLLRPIR